MTTSIFDVNASRSRAQRRTGGWSAMNYWRRWEPEDENFLRNNVRSMTSEALASKLQRSLFGILGKLSAMGLRRDELPAPTKFRLLRSGEGGQIFIEQPEDRPEELNVWAPAGTTASAIAEVFADSQYVDYYTQWKAEHVKA